MHEHTATVTWSRDDAVFTDQQYSRAHRWSFDGGAQIQASASPAVVPEPHADPAFVDPEEAFVAALSSCHMLWFLSKAAARGFVVDRYDDAPVGVMEEDADGHAAMTRVTLRPAVTFAVDPPSSEALQALHDAAHHACFLARSVRTDITVTPRPPGV